MKSIMSLCYAVHLVSHLSLDLKKKKKKKDRKLQHDIIWKSYHPDLKGQFMEGQS